MDSQSKFSETNQFSINNAISNSLLDNCLNNIRTINEYEDDDNDNDDNSISSSSVKKNLQISLNRDDCAAKSFESIPTFNGWRISGISLKFICCGGAAYLHEYCDSLHKKLGTIYREKIGPLDAVFVSDPKMICKVYQNEGKYPNHFVPEAWTIYNEVKGIKRGLFFM